jgi:hypothetical protein
VVDVVILAFYGIGAGVVWIVKGCRTSYVDELAERHETRNPLVAIVIFCILFGLAIYINNYCLLGSPS